MKPKRKGWLGFKVLQTFNLAILTQMAWRATNNIDAFWVLLLKGIYYPNDDFLPATKDAWASWASLLAGKYKVAQHRLCSIGDE